MLQGKVIIVTGASRGLGQRMVHRLAEHGATVVAAARSLSPGHNNPDGAALALAVDVREETQVQDMVQQTLNRYGKIDVLVNNAGLMVGDVAFTNVTPVLWRKILDTNLEGAFFCCWAVVPPMLRQGDGTIVNITSGAAVRTGFLNIAYGVSKAGLDRLTLGLGAELKDRGIACISLSPSISATETVRRMYPDQNVDNWAQSPELPARALCALLEDDPTAYTGQVLSVREFLQSKGLLAQD
jgi:3-oxoacyl-[acyl-carrier protein] reductase